jgi:hypothetical protein
VKWINGYVKRHLGQGPNKDPLSWALERKEVEVALMLGALCGGSGRCGATTARPDAGSRSGAGDGRARIA